MYRIREIAPNLETCPACSAIAMSGYIMCPKCRTSLNGACVCFDNPDDGKTVAILAHITFIGTFAAIVRNSRNRTELGTFYGRQMLGLLIFNFAGFFAAFFIFGYLLLIFNLVIWIISLRNALAHKMKPLPLYGNMFQNWFSGI